KGERLPRRLMLAGEDDGPERSVLQALDAMGDTAGDLDPPQAEVDPHIGPGDVGCPRQQQDRHAHNGHDRGTDVPADIEEERTQLEAEHCKPSFSGLWSGRKHLSAEPHATSCKSPVPIAARAMLSIRWPLARPAVPSNALAAAIAGTRRP